MQLTVNNYESKKYSSSMVVINGETQNGKRKPSSKSLTKDINKRQ